MKEEKLKQEEKYMWAIVDGVKEKVFFFVLQKCSYRKLWLVIVDISLVPHSSVIVR